MSSTVCRIHATFIRIKSLNLEDIGFNESEPNLLFDEIKRFNQWETFDNKCIEDLVFIDTLKHDAEEALHIRRLLTEKVIR